MSSQLSFKIPRFRTLRLTYANRVRRFPLKLGLVLLLAGCAVPLENCILDKPELAVSRDFQELLPTGCQVVEPGLSVTRLACVDGRVGYAFSPSITPQLQNTD